MVGNLQSFGWQLFLEKCLNCKFLVTVSFAKSLGEQYQLVSGRQLFQFGVFLVKNLSPPLRHDILGDEAGDYISCVARLPSTGIAWKGYEQHSKHCQ